MFETIAVGYRATVFALSGVFEFTRQGFEKSSRLFTPGALDSAATASKTILVTGANSGLGRAAAEMFAARGASVHLLCRDETRGVAARDEIAARTNNPEKIFLHLVDVSSVKSIKQFADNWAKTGKQIDVLVNNAGILPATRSETPEGLESTFATNSLGSYALTTLLLQFLKISADARVISVSSGGAFNKKLDISDINYTVQPASTFDGALVYAQTKRQQIEMTEYWAKQYPEIRFYSMHPGWADTPGVQSSIPGFYNAMKDRLRTSEQGADTIVWAAISKEAMSLRNGAFLFDRKEVAQHVVFGGTKASVGDIEKLVKICDEYLKSL
ncbi:Dehydrogenase/reductase SDR member 12 [Physocladia obscura]|uniref:Dehydrogenase/reductase SDR member 12 n=1 Tax=Physocladia obscura TaxID=109957 RepID=A0AAD5SV68_9FUNG|nr:Dehydrogenase/reductase SDR member 12 [Physocladia obscura]